MRDTLTYLAGLLLLVLIAAVAVPPFIDWQVARGQIAVRLSAALGADVRIGGAVGVRLLPAPRVVLDEVQIGAPDSATASSLAVRQLTLELGLTALLKGELRVSDLTLDMAKLDLVAEPSGRIRLPSLKTPSLQRAASVGRMTVLRSTVAWRKADGSILLETPLALQASADRLDGPWRAEGELGAYALRLTTGTLEADGDLRAKLRLAGQPGTFNFDGAFRPSQTTEGLDVGASGAVTTVLPLSKATDEAAPATLNLSAQLASSNGQATLNPVTVEISDTSARLEGEGALDFPAGAGKLDLKARRIDLDALQQRMGARVSLPDTVNALRLPIALKLAVEQISVRGEELTDFALSGELTGGVLDKANGSARFAGAGLSANGRIGKSSAEGQLSLKAPEARRLAFALARAGFPADLADALDAIGPFEASTSGSHASGTIDLRSISLRAASGGLEGKAKLAPSEASFTGKVSGLRLDALPSLQPLLEPLGSRKLALDLGFDNLRHASHPPGRGQVMLEKDGASITLSKLAVEGFGGLSLTGTGELGNGARRISGVIAAPRAESLAALAAPLLSDAQRLILQRAAPGLSPVQLRYAATTPENGTTDLSIEGTLAGGATAGRWKIEQSAASGTAQPGLSGTLRLELKDSAWPLLAMGLPRPAKGLPGHLQMQIEAGRLGGSLSAPGLMLALQSSEQGGASLSVLAEQPQLVVAEGLAKALPQGPFELNSKLSLAETGLRFEALTARSGARAATGDLALARDGQWSGKLKLPQLDLAMLAGQTLGWPEASNRTEIWPTARFAAVQAMPTGQIALELEGLTAGSQIKAGPASLMLAHSQEGLKLSQIRSSYGGGTVTGALNAARDGGLGSLSGQLVLEGLPASALFGTAAGGRISTTLNFGGSGETPARLVAALGGHGELRLSGASVSALDPQALARLIASTGDDAAESEIKRVSGRIEAELVKAPWPVGDAIVPMTLSGGVLRLALPNQRQLSARADFSAMLDLRQMTGDLRANLASLGPLPKGWTPPGPQTSVTWRGPLSGASGGLRREIDAGPVSNAVAARALAREVERIAAFEADLRERAFFARRLRLERDTAEREKRETEARALEAKLREEAERAASAAAVTVSPPASAPRAPSLPPPLDIRSIPEALSRQPRVN
ncbi:MAG: AsmA family protein [Bosea sp. (in: a-proteobacteria)]